MTLPLHSIRCDCDACYYLRTGHARRITAAGAVDSIRFYVAGVTASPQSRTLSGEVVAYGGPVDAEHPDGLNVGLTNIGPLRVRAGALSWSDNLSDVKLTEEHDRGKVRGYAASLVDSPARLRAAFKATDDPDGDAAIAEAIDHKRDGFSLDVVNGVVEDADDGGAPWLVSAVLMAVGQVGLPAFWQGSRIDTVAASASTTEGKELPVTEQQRIRLAELRAKQNRTTEEEAELGTLAALEEAAAADDAGDTPPAPAPAAPAPQAVAASLPAVPGGVPRPTRRGPATTTETPLDAFCKMVADALNPDGGGGIATITAALSDVTHAANGGNIAQPAWSGELWSGVAHEQEFVPLLNSGTLTGRKGQGWRFTEKPVIADYAGDKTAIPSGDIETESTEYTAARMAVGHDIDRAYYDFPDAGFIKAYVEAVRESWSIKIDAKVEAYIAANAVDSTVNVEVIDGDTARALLKAVAMGSRKVKRAKMGKATFAVVGDDLFDTLMELSEIDLPAFMSLFGVEPDKFVSSALAGFEDKVVVGTKMAATLRTLPGSPIRVSAQHLANGGIDEAFFGYWAIEAHAPTGIQFVDVVDLVASPG